MSEASIGNVDEPTPDLTQQDRLIRALELLVQRGATPAGKRRRDWDALAAVIASFIGLLALGVSGYTAYVQRQQLRAQVWPHLALSHANTGSVAMFVTNQGTGPAQKIMMRVVVDGVAVTHWSDVQKAAGYSVGEGVIISQINGSVIPAGKQIAILRPNDQERSLTRFLELLPGGRHAVEVTLCYCSVLHECWATSTSQLEESDVPGPPESCPIRDAERFLE